MKTIPQEIIIIGGSYAGLSAAMALGRSLREVLIIDSGTPCNQQTPASHNFITQDGVAPAEIAAQAKAQVLQYPTINFLEDRVVRAKKSATGYEISTEQGKSFSTQKIILATGVKDVIPDQEGFKACWGISMIHCPYCHGYEFVSKKTGIMANGDRAIHLASLVRRLTDKLSIFTNGKAAFSEEQLRKLNAHHIDIIETEVLALKHDKGYLKQVVLNDGKSLTFEVLYAAFPSVQHTTIAADLGCTLTEKGLVAVNDFQQTSQKGIYACGDNAFPMRSVANAVAQGNLTGAMLNMELVNETF